MKRSRRKAAQGQTAAYEASVWSGRSRSASERFGAEPQGAERTEPGSLQDVERLNQNESNQVSVAAAGIHVKLDLRQPHKYGSFNLFQIFVSFG